MGLHLLRITQVADLCDVDPKTVRRWLRVGKLSFVRLPGGERRVPRAELEAILGRSLHSADEAEIARGGAR